MRSLLLAICFGLCICYLADVTAQDTSTTPEAKPAEAREARKAEPVEVWEYSAYKARVWLSISPTLGLSEATKQLIERKIAECMEIEFGATMQCDVLETPDALFGSVL
ncbi:MAG: hypothetical protein ACK5Q3_12545, partial [Planctomycetota bacterium]